MNTLLLTIAGLVHPVPASPPVHYKIDAKMGIQLDMSAMGGAAMNMNLATLGFVTLTMADTAGGQIASVVVDSSTFDGGDMGAMLPPELSASAKGTEWHIYLVNGKPVGPIVPSVMSLQSGALNSAIMMMFPGAPRNARVGDTWADTTRADTAMEAGSAKGQNVTTWTVKGATGDALDLDGAVVGTTKLGIGGSMDMDMQQTGSIQVTIPRTGPVRSVTMTSTGTATMALGGMSLPMKMTMNMSVSPIP